MCWFSMKILFTWWIFLPPWVIYKEWKGVFSFNFDVNNLMVQSVFNEHQCMIINFHFFSDDQWLFLFFHGSYRYLMYFSASSSDIKNMKKIILYNVHMKNLMVQSVLNEKNFIFINFCLFNVDQRLFLVFQESIVSWWIFL